MLEPIDSGELCDRDQFVEEVEERIFDPRHREQPGALLLLDIDGFHLVNDALGHEAGDRLLGAVGQTLREESRADDLPARICADEFGLLLRRATPEQAMAAAKRLIALVRERGKPAVGASVGIASFGGTGEAVTAEGLMIAADIALCEAKEKGGGRAVNCLDGPNGKLTWPERIRDAIDRQKIVVYAQPIFDLRSHRRRPRGAAGADARRQRGRDPALLLPADRRALRADRRDRSARALEGDRAGRSLAPDRGQRLRGLAFGPGDLVADVRRAIADGLNPGWLDFEITETAAISNMEQAKEFAEEVTGMGCGLGLDDFGTGFSSFSYLKELPVQHLKIDIEFIRDLAQLSGRPAPGPGDRPSSPGRSVRRPSPRASRMRRR